MSARDATAGPRWEFVRLCLKVGAGAFSRLVVVESDKTVFLQRVAPEVLLHLGSENSAPDVTRTRAEVEGDTVCAFFNFWISSIPASTARALRNDLKPSMAETRNLMRRWSCSTMLFK